ncbi:dna-directed dna polymerase : Uncharacterized protein OS=Acanthamoeba castellanii str. Neff GN=ACA1_322130 PE=4 SV=1: DNA_pol_A_exo1: DNA_pol_A [Gemmataceae bacterium]|nr:dna-directed dna polymerase : Uncharacterized protein OS=Acanthamoeba castellanii str. Neff GN=ACA1_322130 PE=4 SV=1: DNA_pol_A_exo1: DNA_pol_A [Gemmataceae bacterium]VTT98777.1 dna-directed dna polymerase : Uncharacterized protein OS=Acanthamoeba castellanii str. Neff GN=ACA1_322130 PE=4 SV=1: DNA_pol_A_exo1: DNA_pol_A [Gemmataceae bacterium]
MEAILELPSVVIGDQVFLYNGRWSGQRLLPQDGNVAFDTETEVVDLKREIPRLALASASAGEGDNCLIHPDDVGRFILVHKGLHFICHNAAFDFWVVERHLRLRQELEALRVWWRIADQNRLHDSMLMDMLVRLARDDRFPEMRDLAVVAQQYAGLTISKDDPFRMRYGEIIGKSWDEVEEGFFRYGIKDAIVTRLAYLAIRKQAVALVEAFGRDHPEIRSDARQKFGLLTEAVQVKKAVALAQITRNGMTVDLEWVRHSEAGLREELQKATARAQAVCPVYKTDEQGRFVLSGKSQVPSFDDQSLREELTRIKIQIERETQAVLRIPTTEKGLSRSVKVWSDYSNLHPFLGHWIKAQGLAKLIQFFAQFQDQVPLGDLANGLHVSVSDLATVLKIELVEGKGEVVKVTETLATLPSKSRRLKKLGLEPTHVGEAIRSLAETHRQPLLTVHPRYSVMIRSGRTSCSGPNVQQIPKDSAFRQAFIARPGSLLLIADYSFIELRTFAATALKRYGWSKMADVIMRDVDPHVHTGAMMLGVPVEEFLTWKNNETVVERTTVDGEEKVTRLKDKFDQARQAAKPVNFGVPGGLGVSSLVSYAHSTYKVDLTQEEAKARRDLLTKEIYPELDRYLAEDGADIIARNLHAPLREVRNELGDTALSSVDKILTGDPKRQDGKPYQKTFVSRVWAGLAGLNRNPGLKGALEKREPSKELAARVCQAGVATLTGRIRGRVRYSQARNTPFQGLAADGAALAMFELVKEGFLVVGFIHDEILTLLPDEGGYVSGAKVQRVKEVMCRRMEDVLIGDIPVDCEVALARRWSKKAKLIERDGKVCAWEPQGDARR